MRDSQVGMGRVARKERAHERQERGKGTKGVNARAKNRQTSMDHSWIATSFLLTLNFNFNLIRNYWTTNKAEQNQLAL